MTTLFYCHSIVDGLMLCAQRPCSGLEIAPGSKWLPSRNCHPLAALGRPTWSIVS